MDRDRGRTLIELLLALALVGLLAGVGLPLLGRGSEAARLRLAAASFGEELRRSFVHAIVRSQRVVLCPAGAGEPARCGEGRDFGTGWLAFVDADRDRERAPDETLLWRAGPATGGIRILSNEGRPRIVIQPDGGNRGTNATFVLCGRHGWRTARSVVLSNDGRIRHDRPSPQQFAERCGAR